MTLIPKGRRTSEPSPTIKPPSYPIVLLDFGLCWHVRIVVSHFLFSCLFFIWFCPKTCSWWVLKGGMEKFTKSLLFFYLNTLVILSISLSRSCIAFTSCLVFICWPLVSLHAGSRFICSVYDYGHGCHAHCILINCVPLRSCFVSCLLWDIHR